MNKTIFEDEEVANAIQTLIDKGVTLDMLEQWYEQTPGVFHSKK